MYRQSQPYNSGPAYALGYGNAPENTMAKGIGGIVVGNYQVAGADLHYEKVDPCRTPLTSRAKVLCLTSRSLLRSIEGVLQ